MPAKSKRYIVYCIHSKKIKYIKWKLNGKVHNPQGSTNPAYESFYNDGTPKYRIWYLHNVFQCGYKYYRSNDEIKHRKLTNDPFRRILKNE